MSFFGDPQSTSRGLGMGIFHFGLDPPEIRDFFESGDFYSEDWGFFFKSGDFDPRGLGIF